MNCPSCGFEYYTEETLKKGICPSCGAPLVQSKEYVPEQAQAHEAEKRTEMRLIEYREIDRKLDSISTGVTYLVAMTLIGLALGGLALYLVIVSIP